MIYLANGCYCSELSVHPKNWDKPGASTDIDWYIFYRFYDPKVLDSNGKIKPKLTPVKGMNEFKTLTDRRTVTRDLLSNELELLKDRDYNPITGYMTEEIEIDEPTDGEITERTPFTQALEWALKNKKAEPSTLTDMKSMLLYINKAAVAMRYDRVPVSHLRRKHLKLLLNQCGKIKEKTDIPIGKTGRTKKGIWSANQFNHYCKYLSALYSDLLEVEAVDTNPFRDMRKQKHATNIRKVLTPEECKKVDDFARQYNIRYWMLIHIFFHSGSRTTEMFRVQGKHVDLARQMVDYLVKKGNNFVWVQRPIKDVALPFWEKAMEACGPNDFVFSKGMKPGPVSINSHQVSRWWRKHIKKGLGIVCDWYALKYLHTDQVAALLTLKEAQQHNAQTNLTTARIYAINEEHREHNRVMHLPNKFAG